MSARTKVILLAGAMWASLVLFVVWLAAFLFGSFVRFEWTLPMQGPVSRAVYLVCCGYIILKGWSHLGDDE